MKLHPYGLPLMLEAWQGCVAWAAKEPAILDRFLDGCGPLVKAAMRPRSALDRMIDSAGGMGPKVFAEFCDFVTKEFWGEEGAEDEVPPPPAQKSAGAEKEEAKP